MADIKHVTDGDFQAEVLENEHPVLVDFWAPWCGPCRVVAPVLEEIADERDNLRIVKVNIDENQQTAMNYQILAIPTMVLFRDGQEAKRIQGAMPKKRLEDELEPALAGAWARVGRSRSSRPSMVTAVPSPSASKPSVRASTSPSM